MFVDPSATMVFLKCPQSSESPSPRIGFAEASKYCAPTRPTLLKRMTRCGGWAVSTLSTPAMLNPKAAFRLRLSRMTTSRV